MSDDSQELSFERGLEKLEGIVKKLEDGDVSLEQSVELFEQGIQLSSGLRKQLDEAESKVEILTRKGTDYAPKPFDLDRDG